MNNLSTNIMLDRLNGAERIVHNGVNGTFIPDAPNDIFVSEKGHVYLKLTHWLNKYGPDPKGNTHQVKLSMSKEFAAANPQLTGQNAPILGSSKTFAPKTPQMPYQQTPAPPTYPNQGYQR